MANRVSFLGDTFRYDPQYHKLADFLSVNTLDRDDLEIAQKIFLIWDWAQINSKGDFPQDAMWQPWLHGVL